jgi:peptidoglycan/LPS O-acetylase OafA/YrhL
MKHRNTITKLLLVLYVFGSVAVILPLVLDRAGDLSATTSGKILAAALGALAVGAALALRDPWSHRAIIQMLIVFLSLAAIGILYRLLSEGHPPLPTAAVLAVDLAGAVLFVAFYPRPPGG